MSTNPQQRANIPLNHPDKQELRNKYGASSCRQRGDQTGFGWKDPEVQQIFHHMQVLNQHRAGLGALVGSARVNRKQWAEV